MTAPPGLGAGIIDEAAPAKINLALHVTGRRADGYHLLDSLVVFAEVGDHVRVDPAGLGLTVDGPFADAVPTGPDNLCLRAAEAAGASVGIALTKNLPVASGIGGGSADAAAVLRALARLGHPLPDEPARLGADVPVCLRAPRPARMEGIGEVIAPVPPLPRLELVLANPGVPLSTPAVFRGLGRADNPPMEAVPAGDAAALTSWLSEQRNDLQAPAIGLVPVIADVLDALTGAGAILARMSGSGASCFGIFPDRRSAEGAAAALGRRGWWAVATRTLG